MNETISYIFDRAVDIAIAGGLGFLIYYLDRGKKDTMKKILEKIDIATAETKDVARITSEMVNEQKVRLSKLKVHYTSLLSIALDSYRQILLEGRKILEGYVEDKVERDKDYGKINDRINDFKRDREFDIYMSATSIQQSANQLNGLSDDIKNLKKITIIANNMEMMRSVH